MQTPQQLHINISIYLCLYQFIYIISLDQLIKNLNNQLFFFLLCSLNHMWAGLDSLPDKMYRTHFLSIDIITQYNNIYEYIYIFSCVCAFTGVYGFFVCVFVHIIPSAVAY